MFGGDILILMSQIIKVKSQMVQLAVGPKVYYGNNAFNPDWGVKLNISLIYPKKNPKN